MEPSHDLSQAAIQSGLPHLLMTFLRIRVMTRQSESRSPKGAIQSESHVEVWGPRFLVFGEVNEIQVERGAAKCLLLEKKCLPKLSSQGVVQLYEFGRCIARKKERGLIILWVQCGFKFLVGGFDVEDFGGVAEPPQFDSLDIHITVER